MPSFSDYLVYILQMCILLISISGTTSKECYVCSGYFPSRECELWPATVKHSGGKQECGDRFCTTHVRYRPMQHLLIPLGPNQGKATAAPLQTSDFEVVSINRDCVEREGQNRCVTDADGLGVQCYTSCTDDLCNGGLRKPTGEELSLPKSKNKDSPPPTGPSEFDHWKPSTKETTPKPTIRTSPPKIHREEEKRRNNGHRIRINAREKVREEKRGDEKVDKDHTDKEVRVGNGRRGGKPGNRANIRGYPVEPETVPESGSTRAKAHFFFIASLIALLFH